MLLHSDLANLWHYHPTEVAGVVELGLWSSVGTHGLRPHFHDEAQVTVVLFGSRAFLINELTVTVTAGQAISIPAKMVHTPLRSSNETVCLNLYVASDCAYSSFKLSNIDLESSNAFDISNDDILRLSNDLWTEESARSIEEDRGSYLRTALINNPDHIGNIAANFNCSREGFSRQVKRELGVAPHAFRILSRLNRARQLLREGCAIADAAAESGFSDQSHMTRLFRQTFGTTPGLYLRG